MRFVKRNPQRLRALAIWIICVRMLDIFWYVAPAFRQREFAVYWTDLTALVGMGGIWLAYFISNLKKRPMLVPNDPRNTYSVARSAH